MGVLEDAFTEATKGLDLMEKRDRFIAAYVTRRAAKLHQQKPSADGSQLAAEIVREQENMSRRSGSAKYRATTIGKYQVTKEGWSIVSTDDLTQQPVRKPASYSEAVESLRQLQQQEPAKAAELKILRLSELKKVQQ